MKVDLEELSAHFGEMNDRSFTETERADAQRRFVKLAIKNFPAIVAKLEVAESSLKPFVEMVAHGCETGKIKSASILCGAPTDNKLEMKSLGKLARETLASFDKEQA